MKLYKYYYSAIRDVVEIKSLEVKDICELWIDTNHFEIHHMNDINVDFKDEIILFDVLSEFQIEFLRRWFKKKVKCGD